MHLVWNGVRPAGRLKVACAARLLCNRERRLAAPAGMADGHDSKSDRCIVCFQRGKDVQIATGQNTCGPLCGYKCAAL